MNLVPKSFLKLYMYVVKYCINLDVNKSLVRSSLTFVLLITCINDELPPQNKSTCIETLIFYFDFAFSFQIVSRKKIIHK